MFLSRTNVPLWSTCVLTLADVGSFHGQHLYCSDRQVLSEEVGAQKQTRDGKIRANCHDGTFPFRSDVLVFNNLRMDIMTAVPEK